MILWVYGSLKRGERHHDELGGAELLGHGRTLPRYALSRSGEYPALVAGSEVVSGELYRVTPELLARLDVFEGAGYQRGRVVLEDGREVLAYVASGWTGSPSPTRSSS
ncbi:MAG: gamma-glutamylcyclotransferase [Polyangiaceae bacterium]|nr:gamma-glutamylcyclotransferase [Polyangiaceae bacterium]MCL4748941.1 gamma-glutamylcyclotransferase [Myxococcales bacterium]